MDPLLIFALLAVGIGASILGTIFGIGGGIIFIPVLTILFGLSANEAIAVSLVGIIATSAGAASHHVRTGASNVRLGQLLGITASAGATAGALLAILISANLGNWFLLCLFGCVLIYSAAMMIIRKEKISEGPETENGMCFTYVDETDRSEKRYEVVNVGSGLLVSSAAGALSSMTGVGGGTINVPLMNVHMRVPIKVSTATSSYVIGITAFTGIVIYFLQGELLPDYAAAIAVGAVAGSLIGTRIAKAINAGPLRRYFSVLLFAIAAIIFLEAGGVL